MIVFTNIFQQFNSYNLIILAATCINTVKQHTDDFLLIIIDNKIIQLSSCPTSNQHAFSL